VENVERIAIARERQDEHQARTGHASNECSGDKGNAEPPTDRGLALDSFSSPLTQVESSSSRR